MFSIDARRKSGLRPIAPLAVIAMTAIVAAPSFGQGQGGRPGFGGGAPGFGGGPGGRGMVVGTILQIDRARSAVQVQSGGQQGESRWVVVSEQASVTRQVEGKLSELKPNDTIVVTGVPLSIQASQIQVGEIPVQQFGGPGGGGPGFGGPGGGGPGFGGPGGGGPGGGAQGARAAGAGAQGRGGQGPGGGPNTRATGTVVTTSPLVVMLPGNIKVNVTADSSTRITRSVKVSLADLKVGETLMAMGQPDENGNVVAMQVTAGIDPNAGFGGGQFQRRPGGGQQP